jgi:hypothetical protein
MNAGEGGTVQAAGATQATGAVQASGTVQTAGSAQASGSAQAAGSGQVIAALQNALEAEQAASYGYGVVGAHMPQGSARQGDATADWVAHMRARDQLTEMISTRGGKPAPAAVAYQLPSLINSPAQAAAGAAAIEDRVAQAYLGLVALMETGLRSFGAQQVRAAALRAAAWRGSTQAFPGLPVDSLRR